MTSWCTVMTWSSFVARDATRYDCSMSLGALEAQGRAVREAATVLGQASNEARRAVLLHVADRLQESCDELLAINAKDVSAYSEPGAGVDRLTLSPARVDAMAEALREIASHPDPLFEVLDQSERPNGLHIERLRVPLGVIGVVYENRPNVTSDVAGLCVRSGNAAYLRGSSTAFATNQFIVSLWHDALEKEGLPAAGVSLVQDSSHETATAFMQLTDVLDCLIPRGGPSLIAAMREHARVPYVLDGDGNCHVFVDESADVDNAVAIVRNAKTSRPGVCNAAETVLVHESVAATFLPALSAAMPEVELRVDDAAKEYLPDATPASEGDYEREFLDLILAVKVVDSLDEAIAHVSRYGTGHSEAILTRDLANAEAWVKRVDAAAVVVNASTRFVDGGELGLGGEVGISTQKLHARGPMGLRELTCLKWVVRGEGQIR
jgi:glutamate-5-semialdehyde dehydrogenase